MNERKERNEVVRDCNNALKIFLNSLDDIVNKFSYNREKTKIKSEIVVEQIFNIEETHSQEVHDALWELYHSL